MDPEARAALRGALSPHDPTERHERTPGPRALTSTILIVAALLGVDLLLGGFSFSESIGKTLVSIAFLIGVAKLGFRALAVKPVDRVAAEVLPVLACLGIWLAGSPRIAAAVVLIALVAQWLVAITLRRARRSFQALRDARPRKALVTRDGEDVEILAESIVVGDRLIVRPGEKIAADGVVIAGRSAVDQSILSGATLPETKTEGDPVFAGTVNHLARIDVSVRKVGSETILSKLIGRLDEARRSPSLRERRAETQARWFPPIILAASALIFLATNAAAFRIWARSGVWPVLDWMPALAALVSVSNGALVLATPTAIRSASTRLARRGLFLRTREALERLARVDALAFARTGALTTNLPDFGEVVTLGAMAPDDLLRIAATAEAPSEHPLALMLLGEAKRKGVKLGKLSDFRAIPGAGVSATLAEGKGRRVLVGSSEFLRLENLWITPEVAQAVSGLEEVGQTALLVAVDGQIVGVLGARWRIREGAREAIANLRDLGLTDLTILTGDRPTPARSLAGSVSIEQVVAELAGSAKADWLDRRTTEGRYIAYLGNDPQALAATSLGFACPGLAAEIAATSASIVVTGDPITPLPAAIRLSRQTLRVIQANLSVFAIGLNIVSLALAAFREVGPIGAVVLAQLGSLLALWNATRLLGFDAWWRPTLVRLSGQFRSINRAFWPSAWPGWIWDRGRHLPARPVVVALVLGYLATGLTIIGPRQVGLVQRFGAYRPPVLPPGIHWTFPVPIDSVAKVEPDLVRLATFVSPGDQNRDDSALFVTGDEGLVGLRGLVEYRLTNAGAAALEFEVESISALISVAAEGVLREALAKTASAEALGAGRRTLELDATLKLRERLGKAGLKVSIDRLLITEARPPSAVLPAFHNVSAAVADAAKARSEALAYASVLHWSTLAEASEVRDLASARGNGLKVSAEGDRLAFLAFAAAHSERPDLTEFRLWWETLADTYAGRRALILAPKASGRGHVLLTDPASAGPEE